nr:hypothetical protein [uncultured bacterium]
MPFRKKRGPSALPVCVLSAITMIGCGKPPTEPVAVDTVHEEAELASQTLALVAPDPAAKAYVQYTETRDPSVTTFNHQSLPQGVRDVQIAGKHVVLDQADVAQLRARLESAPDLRKLEIFADKLIVRAAIKLPATELRIHAREVRFEDQGSIVANIDTTPLGKNLGADQFASGVHGLKAGDVHLYVSSFFSDGDRPNRFVMRGGRGQNAGLGAHGENRPAVLKLAQSAPNLIKCAEDHGLSSGYNRRTQRWNPAEIDLNELRHQVVALAYRGPDDSQVPAQALPLDGGDARPGGKPGNGGDAGTLYTNLSDLARYADRSGGTAGNVAGSYGGGTAGTPTPAIKLAYAGCQTQVIHQPGGGPGRAIRALVVRVEARKTPVHGRGATSPAADRPVGSAGNAVVVDSPEGWVHPHAIELGITFAEDAFINDFRELAKSELDSLSAALDTYVGSAVFASATPEQKAQIAQQELRVRSLLNRIAGNEDYFGNPSNWVPALSLEANMGLFEREVPWAIRAIFVSDWLAAQNNQQKDNLAAALEAQRLLREEIERLEVDFNAALEEIPELKQKAQAVGAETEGLTAHLQAVEAQLVNRARENVEDSKKLPFWKKGLRVLAAVARSIPVGQPILNGIGSGIDLLVNMDPDKPWDTIKQAPDVIKKFTESKVGEKAKEAKDKKEEKDVKNEQDKKKLKESLKDIQEFVKPVIEELKKQKDLFATVEVKDEELKKELEKLKKESPEFAELSARVEQLTKRREELALSLTAVVERLEQTATQVNQSYLEISDLMPDVANSARVILSQRAELSLRSMRERALDRLVKYQYWLKKAYEYRALKPYTGDLTLRSLFDEMRVLIGSDSENGVLPLAQAEALYTTFRDELSVIAQAMAQELNSNNGVHKRASFTYALSSADLAALNSGRFITIDPWEDGAFEGQAEDVRLVSVEVESFAQTASGSSTRFGYHDLEVAHDGLSRLFRRGKVHLFRHYNKQAEQPIAWTSRFENGSVRNIPLSPSTSSLLHALLGGTGHVDMMLFSQPAAWAKLRLSARTVSDGDLDIDLSSLALRVTYDYADVNSSFAQHVETQEGIVQGQFQALLKRSAADDELASSRLLLDLGYGTGELVETIEAVHEEEFFRARFSELHASAYSRAPSSDELAWGSAELMAGRPSQQVREYLTTINEVVLDIYGRLPNYDELVMYTRVLDAGLE